MTVREPASRDFSAAWCTYSWPNVLLLPASPSYMSLHHLTSTKDSLLIVSSIIGPCPSSQATDHLSSGPSIVVSCAVVRRIFCGQGFRLCASINKLVFSKTAIGDAVVLREPAAVSDFLALTRALPLKVYFEVEVQAYEPCDHAPGYPQRE